MATIVAYLTHQGNCREAMTFYKDCFGGELNLMTLGESPVGAQASAAEKDLIMHADLRSRSLRLMASDNLGGGVPVTTGTMINLMVYCESEEEIRAIFPKLAREGRVNSELKVEFWGSLYGDITDRYGVRWMLNYDMPKS